MVLRPIFETDQSVFLELFTDETIKQTYMLPDYPKKEDAIPLFLRLAALSRDASRFVRAICADGVVVGFLNDVEIVDGTLELGYVIHPRHQNRGFATAALKLAIRELFSMGYREVLAGAFSENTASLRVMEKAGMEKLSKHDTIEYRGIVHSCVYYHIFL